MRVAVVLTLAACGRIGYEPLVPGADATDATPDGAATCPSDTTPVTINSVDTALLCIEKTERGNAIWVDAKAACEAAGRRLCFDAEWAAACDASTGLVDMTDGNWEWMADETGGIALKRGVGLCSDMSSHGIFVDAYDYRCCVNI